jgi:hypothetical protein
LFVFLWSCPFSVDLREEKRNGGGGKDRDTETGRTTSLASIGLAIEEATNRANLFIERFKDVKGR